MKNVAVFGSTGSIGKQTLSVCAMHPELFRVTVLVFGSNHELGIEQIERFDPLLVGVFDSEAARIVRERFPDREIVSGASVWELASSPETDAVVNGVSGFCGLFPLINALKSGKTVALANKESVVCAGSLVRKAMLEGGGRIMPVDSEQSAILQCLASGRREDVRSLVLTASGGAFRTLPKEQLSSVTPEMAMRHPTWSMGRKITIDSATLFNKGLEVMETAFLFDSDADGVSVLIHPQSVVHSMVEYKDGSVIAQLGVPDMRLAIQYALTYPERTASPVSRLDLCAYDGLSFFKPDEERFPALGMAYRALREQGALPTAYNSGNEAAVERFVKGELGFTDIARCVEYVMDRMTDERISDMETLLSADDRARRLAREFSAKRMY